MTGRINIKPRAFTLVEMLIAVTLTAMMVATVVDSVMRSANFYQTHAGELERAAAARQVLDTITRDLSAAVLRDSDTDVWLAADILTDTNNSGRWMEGGKPSGESLQLRPPSRHNEDDEPAPRTSKPTTSGPIYELPDYRFGQAGIWLRFFGMPEDRDMGKPRTGTVRRPGDVNAMAYQLIRTGTPMGGGVMDKDRPRYQLFRSIVDADLTFNLGYDIMSYKQGKGPPKLGSPSNIRTPHPDTVLSEQVLDVGFVFHERNSMGKVVEAWPTRDSSLGPLKTKRSSYQVPIDGKPLDVEIFVRVISRHGATKLAARELSNLSPDEWWKIAQQESRLFKRTMPLRWSE